jgi:hypothetical protein
MASNDEPLAESGSPAIDLYNLDCCIIEIAGEAVGLVTMGDHGVTFHAAAPETWPLDCCSFASRQDAASAVRELLRAHRQRWEPGTSSNRLRHH